MHAANIVEGIKVSDFPDDGLSVWGIFRHNHNWEVYEHDNPDGIRPEVKEEVRKLFTCKDDGNGFIEYFCDTCEEFRTIHLGCNGRLCSSCGKTHTDRWATELPKAMYDVPHRHIVLSLPDRLWPVFLDKWERMKVLMDSAILVLKDVMSHNARRRITPGAVVVMHPFGRDLGFKPHVHIIVTEGGFDGSGEFVHMTHIPYRAMRKSWQYHVLTELKRALPKTADWAGFINFLFKDYPEGFYAYLPPESRITSLRNMGKYLARYVRHPAIANFRLFGYDGRNVTFWYQDHENKRHYKTMAVFDFMRAITQHIPARQFKVIRHYGACWRRLKSRLRNFLALRSLRQANMEEYEPVRRNICSVCGSKMLFLKYQKKKPPDEVKFGERIVDWRYIVARPT
jgi:hypothetical protein